MAWYRVFCTVKAKTVNYNYMVEVEDGLDEKEAQKKAEALAYTYFWDEKRPTPALDEDETEISKFYSFQEDEESFHGLRPTDEGFDKTGAGKNTFVIPLVPQEEYVGKHRKGEE